MIDGIGGGSKSFIRPISSDHSTTQLPSGWSIWRDDVWKVSNNRREIVASDQFRDRAIQKALSVYNGSK